MPEATSRLKGYHAKIVNYFLLIYFRQISRNKKFCIISNDCWGAEIYKVLNRPFNTPFIGLMLMSPCYIKLLENPQYYLKLPLVFKGSSNYPSMRNLNSGISFPLATLGDSDIEIHFLHYKSEEIAKEKWDRRVKKIDWTNLFVKYDCGKDYANKDLMETFLNLPFSNKLVFGNENYGNKNVYVLKNYSTNAMVQFRNCFLNIDPINWLKRGESITNSLQKFICKIAYKYI